MKRASIIEALIAFLAITLFVSIVRADTPTFTVVNKMPAFTVENKCPVDVPQKPYTPKSKLAAFSSTATVKQATQTVITTRAPTSHTHTCPRCGTTWDHAANPGHTCLNCGTTQYRVDPVSRPVTVRKTVQTAAPVANPGGLNREVNEAITYWQSQRFVPVTAQPACANGQCSTVTRIR